MVWFIWIDTVLSYFVLTECRGKRECLPLPESTYMLCWCSWNLWRQELWIALGTKLSLPAGHPLWAPTAFAVPLSQPWSVIFHRCAAILTSVKGMVCCWKGVYFMQKKDALSFICYFMANVIFLWDSCSYGQIDYKYFCWVLVQF